MKQEISALMTSEKSQSLDFEMKIDSLQQDTKKTNGSLKTLDKQLFHMSHPEAGEQYWWLYMQTLFEIGMSMITLERCREFIPSHQIRSYDFCLRQLQNVESIVEGSWWEYKENSKNK